jgi:hypothetical protein
MNFIRIIASCAMSSIIIGAVVALLIVAAIYMLIMRSKQADGLSSPGYVLAVVFVVLLAWNSIKIVGAINIKSKCNDVITLIDNNNIQSVDDSTYSDDQLIATIVRGVEPTVAAVRTKVVAFRESLNEVVWKSAVSAAIIIVISFFLIPYTVVQSSTVGRDRRNVAHKSASRYRRRRR